MSNPKTPAIVTQGITKTFRTSDGEKIPAVRGVSFAIDEGEVVALLGPNGAGKSTIIDMILGLICPDDGTAEIFGGDALRSARSGRTAAVTQSGGFLPDATVAQTMRLIGALRPGANVEACMARANIQHLRGRQVSKCSGGELQRLRFALALLSDPDLLILDEPTAGMDVESRHDFWREIRLDADAGRTILFATHYLDEVDDFADRVILIQSGQIVADDTADAIRARSGGCTVSAVMPQGALERLELSGTTLLDQRFGRTYLHNSDADALARRVLDLGGSDLRVVPRSLDDAFLALTSVQGGADV